jgi:hypothetical protein
MARQVALQWPGAIPRSRSLDCSATPSDSMKWRPHADHGQKHETGDRMHSELDERGPITEEPFTRSYRMTRLVARTAIQGLKSGHIRLLAHGGCG